MKQLPNDSEILELADSLQDYPDTTPYWRGHKDGVVKGATKIRSQAEEIITELQQQIQLTDHLIERHDKEMEELREENRMLGGAFPLVDVLERLSKAADIFLHKKDYDGPDYEEMEMCLKRAKEIVEALKTKE